MDETKVKEIFQKELEVLKASLPAFVKPEDMQKEIADLKKQIEEQNVKGLADQLASLEEAAQKQGEILNEIRNSGGKKVKSLRDMLAEKSSELNTLADADSSNAGKIHIRTSVKSVLAGSISDDTMAYRDSDIGKIQRGTEWIRNLFNVVTLGNNSHGTVRWYEQATITDNSEMVAEATAPSAESDMTWVEKNLSGKRIKAFTKISKDQLKDVDFVESEVRETILKSLRLKENSQLYNGDGVGQNIEGIYTKAPAFNPAGISIASANLFDLINKGKTQIRTASKDGFFPNNVVLNPEDLDTIRLAKDAENRYLFPEWAINGLNTLAGMNVVENSLATANTLLMGDFNYGTVYVWDGLGIEMGYIDDDFTAGMVTIVVYERINLRVKDTDLNAFLKVADVATAIGDITAPSAP